jgi:two-component system, OmpR family, heavy metal sensor histidine kinase CusS
MTLKAFSWRQMSLAARVTLLVGTTFLICVLMLGLVVQSSISGHFAEQDADELRVVSASVQRALGGETVRTNGDDLHTRLENAVSGHHGMYYAVFDSEGNMLFSTPGPKLSGLLTRTAPVKEADASNLYRWTEGDSTYRGVVIAMQNDITEAIDAITIVVAAEMDFHLQFMDEFRRKLWSILGCASVVILLSAWLAVRIAHQPLNRISEDIGNITSEKLNLRLNPEGVPADLLGLVTSFNDMMERVDDVFQRLSNFSADIAHELRTPITNLTTQTQVSLSKARSSEEYQEILYSNLEEYERMARMINDMLWLAQAENGTLKPLFETLDLAAEVTDLFDYLGAWAEHCNLDFVLEGGCPMIEGDKEMLRRALTNLLTNAIHYAKTESSIVVGLDSDDKNVSIVIENVGEEIPAEHMSKLFDRFYRADLSRQRSGSGSGAGLGLAIVNSIVELHGGHISVKSEHRRTAFHIMFPITASGLTG